VKGLRTPFFLVDRKTLDHISKTNLHQGVIGFFTNLPSLSLQNLVEKLGLKISSSFFVLLTEIEYEQNLGAMLRTAEAAGVAAIVIPPSSKGVTPVVERVSMGAASLVPVISESLFPALKIFKKWGFKIIGLDEKAPKNYYDEDLRGPLVFVVGGESKGITFPVRKRCDVLVKIPQKGKISSLNLSVACGIVVFEKMRQETKR